MTEHREDRSGIVAPRNSLELQLVRIWEEILGRSPIGIDQDFFQLGGDSILALGLLAQIARDTGCQLPASGLLTATTVEKLAAALREGYSAENWSPLVPMQPLGARPPFFCVHPGGGNVLCYLNMARRMGTERPFYGLQAAGVDGILPPMSSIEEMATSYVEAIRRAHPHGPYAIGGWSVGGIVAYEMAQQLCAAGQEVSTVAIFDSGVLYACALMTALFPRGDIGMLDLLRCSSATQIDDFRRRSAIAKIVPDNADDAQASLIFRLFVSNMRAVLNYRAESYPGRIDLFQASERLAAARHAPYREWCQRCEHVVLHEVPGNHLTMVQEPHVAQLTEALSTCLNECMARAA